MQNEWAGDGYALQTCLLTGCTNQVQLAYPSCRSCTALLPRQLHQRLLRCYREYNEDSLSKFAFKQLQLALDEASAVTAVAR